MSTITHIKKIEFRPNDIFYQLTDKFAFFYTSKIAIYSHLFKKITIGNIIEKIDSYSKTTGIMIGNISVTENNNEFMYFFIFDEIIILLDDIEIHKFQHFFGNMQIKKKLFFLNSDCENLFQIFLKTQFAFNNKNHNYTEINQAKIVRSLINAIGESIIKKSQIRTLKRYFESKSSNYIISNEIISFKYEDFISIAQIGNLVSLNFNTYDQYLYVLKKFQKNDPKKLKSFEHEKTFYTNLKNINPFICRFFGFTQNFESNIIIIEYIEGTTLEDFIKNEGKNLSKKDKLQIILGIMSALEYLYLNNYIYRDLKFDNILIDTKRNAILIDFDQAKQNDGTVMTTDIGSPLFVSPEQFSTNNYSFKTDIYSLGKIIDFILTNHLSTRESPDHYINLDIPQGYEKFIKINKKCQNKLPENRPSIINVLNYYLNNLINDEIYQNNPLFQQFLVTLTQEREKLFNSLDKKQIKNDVLELANYLGVCYLYSIYVSKNINKSIHYFTIAFDQFDSVAQFYLGQIYYFGDTGSKDIPKSIHFLKLSSFQNNPCAQLFLGEVYYYGENIPRNIKKAIHYFKLASCNNDSLARYFLGKIYYEDTDITQDINKSLHYLTLSSEQNNSDAQFFLGKIYYYDKRVQNIAKSIQLFTQSSNQNNSNAQCLLGKIYYNGGHVKQNINKSIQLLTQSSNQNNSEAQYLLGCIYLEGKYVMKNINKFLYYITLSANQNNHKALLALGMYYYFNGDEIDGKKIINSLF